MADIKNVTKALAVQEDIAYGEGTIAQTRGGIAFPTLNLVRTIQPVNSLAELNALDTDKFKKAALFINNEVILYSFYAGSWNICTEDRTSANLALSNGWLNDGAYGLASVSKTQSSIVQLSGTIKSGTVTPGTLVSNIPAPYRPTTLKRLVTGNSAGLVILQIAISGNLTIEAGTNALVALDHLSYNI